ncbi:MAG TPA: RNA methyltransferase [Candidatus Acidoferrum sp.]|nr:RNA methyltransferase [Candidatus Acidoferrum sp.]
MPSKAARNVRVAGESALLTSRDNRWLKEFRMALRGGLPTETGFVGVEGVRLVEEALRSGCPIQAVLFSESGQRHHERLAPLIDRPEMAFPTLRTTDRLFEGLADTEHPQGVAALVKPRETSFDDLVNSAGSACAPLLVVLAGVQDPGNVGTILRTAAAFGATGAATAASGVSGTASPYSPKALRASAGAALHLPILAGMSLPILLTQFKIAGIRTLASSVHDSARSAFFDVVARHVVPSSVKPAPAGLTGNPRGEGEPDRPSSRHSSLATRHFPEPLAPWQVDWCQPIALLVGNEGAGLPEEIERSADARIHIPMATGVESLNAAAAAAVVFYEAARQRNSKPL